VCRLGRQHQRADVAFPGIEVVGWLALDADVLVRLKLRLDRRHNALGDLVLDGEDVGNLAVVTFLLNVVATSGFDQLRHDTDAAAGPANAPFD
jgi:hypothetical protein